MRLLINWASYNENGYMMKLNLILVHLPVIVIITENYNKQNGSLLGYLKVYANLK